MASILSPVLIVAVGGALLLSACSSKDTVAKQGDTTATNTPAAGTPDTSPRPHGGMGDAMRGMSGSQTGMMSADMMASMQTHLHTMQDMGADQMRGTLPTHRQMVADMLAQMNQEMRQMNMPFDARWKALTDSLRQDLVRMPTMTAAELHAFMPAHSARVVRLMEMHRTMMSRM